MLTTGSRWGIRRSGGCPERSGEMRMAEICEIGSDSASGGMIELRRRESDATASHRARSARSSA